MAAVDVRDTVVVRVPSVFKQDILDILETYRSKCQQAQERALDEAHPKIVTETATQLRGIVEQIKAA